MRQPRFTMNDQNYRLPAAAAPSLQPNAFSLCSAFVPQCADHWAMVQHIYMCAFQEAQAVAKPSLPERDLLAVWN